MSRLDLTPAQTVGPYLAIGLSWDDGPFAVPPTTVGAVWIRGRLLDGTGGPGPDGSWSICTLKPGPVPSADGRAQAPHLDVSVFARGLLDRVVTRIYFADEAAANAADLVLRTVPEKRRATIVAASSADGYRLDIRLQGADETVFFDL